MVKSDQVTARVSPNEKKLLLTLAEIEDRKPSDLLRHLIRQAARKHGLLVCKPCDTPHPAESVGQIELER